MLYLNTRRIKLTLSILYVGSLVSCTGHTSFMHPDKGHVDHNKTTSSLFYVIRDEQLKNYKEIDIIKCRKYIILQTLLDRAKNGKARWHCTEKLPNSCKEDEIILTASTNDYQNLPNILDVFEIRHHITMTPDLNKAFSIAAYLYPYIDLNTDDLKKITLPKKTIRRFIKGKNQNFSAVACQLYKELKDHKNFFGDINYDRDQFILIKLNNVLLIYNHHLVSVYFIDHVKQIITQVNHNLLSYNTPYLILSDLMPFDSEDCLLSTRYLNVGILQRHRGLKGEALNPDESRIVDYARELRKILIKTWVSKEEVSYETLDHFCNTLLYMIDEYNKKIR